MQNKSIGMGLGLNMKLQGYLLGYEVLQGDIVVQKHTYETPVKNLVVDSGKDFLMKSNNSLSTTTTCLMTGLVSYPVFGYLSGSNSGVLGFCGRGSGSTSAAASDTGLQAPIGNKTSTILAGDPNTGTRFDREAGKVVMRVTHDHETESTDQNINELAWFGYGSSAYVMFSRIVVPSTITVLTGQKLRTIYQLEVSISPTVSTSVSPTITGWTTEGDYRWECAFPATSSTFTSPPAADFSLFDTLYTTGTTPGTSSVVYPDTAGLRAASQSSSGNGVVTMYGSSKTFNSFGTRTSNETASATIYQAFSASSSSGTATSTTANYTDGNFYRDCTYVFDPNWTGYASISVYAMRIRGLMYIFDTPQTKSNTQRLTLVYRISVT